MDDVRKAKRCLKKGLKLRYWKREEDYQVIAAKYRVGKSYCLVLVVMSVVCKVLQLAQEEGTHADAVIKRYDEMGDTCCTGVDVNTHRELYCLALKYYIAEVCVTKHFCCTTLCSWS